MTFQVLEPGLQTTVQDLGRPGYLWAGISLAGAQDSLSLQLGNLLLGNDLGEPRLLGRNPGAAGLEMLIRGPKLAAQIDTAIAITGAAMKPCLDGAPIPAWTVVPIRAGQILDFGVASLGARAYLTVAGGIDVKPILGSRSSFIRGSLGGIVSGRALVAGDVLPIGRPSRSPGELSGRRLRSDLVPTYDSTPLLRAMLGPQDHLVTRASIDAFFSSPWTLSPNSNRMGMRFTGPSLSFRRRPKYLDVAAGADPSNIVDDAIATGAIQVPAGQAAVVMGVEGPTLGGYVKIATLIAVDWSRLAQIRPGQTIKFARVNRNAAVRLWREEQAILSESALVIERAVQQPA
jgi:biotin-dependent carboxylase-like uncharacterized protein